MFIYDGRIWVVYDDNAFGGNQVHFINPDGSISQGFLMRNNNGLNEVTPYWVNYNEYFIGDIVVHNGITYEAIKRSKNKVPSNHLNSWRVIS